MTFSPFDHPHFEGTFMRSDLAASFTPEAEIAAMLRFEAALAEAEAELGLIPADAAAAIADAIRRFRPDPKALAEGVARDGLVVPSLIAALRDMLDAPHRPHLHVGATSQDVIDTGLVLRLKPALALLHDDLRSVIAKLERLIAEKGGMVLMGRTRMQRALPITLGDRLESWKAPLERHLEALGHLEKDLLVVQFGGPVGTLESLDGKGPKVRAALARRLDLGDPGRCWHAERGRIADLAGWLARVAGALGKIGQDVALMAQNEVGEAVLEGGGRSSAMAHKRNPVKAELLVTLARFAACQLAAVHQALVHEGERSGSAWALEWLALPPTLAAAGAALSLARDMLDQLAFVER